MYESVLRCWPQQHGENAIQHAAPRVNAKISEEVLLLKAPVSEPRRLVGGIVYEQERRSSGDATNQTLPCNTQGGSVFRRAPRRDESPPLLAPFGVPADAGTACIGKLSDPPGQCAHR